METPEKLMAFLTKYNIASDTYLITKSADHYQQMLGQNYTRIPEVLFFNNEGYFIPYRSSPESCGVSPGLFASTLLQGSPQMNDSIHLDSILHFFQWQNQDQAVSFSALPQTDFYVLVLWAKFAGKLNKKALHEWREQFKQARQEGLRLHELLANLDPQENWLATEKTPRPLNSILNRNNSNH